VLLTITATSKGKIIRERKKTELGRKADELKGTKYTLDLNQPYLTRECSSAKRGYIFGGLGVLSRPKEPLVSLFLKVYYSILARLL